MSDLLYKLIASIAPGVAVRRAHNRLVLASYEAGQASRLRKFSRDKRSGSVLAKAYAGPVRDQARALERNHDIARGILRKLVNNTIGPSGIAIEPQPRAKDGSIHEEAARLLTDLWRNWCRSPEVTFQHNFAKVQRIAAAAWFRDGEIFAQMLGGPVPGLNHRSLVQFSLELLEADMVPSDVEDGSRVQQGIERNAWGQPVSYRVLKVHPGDGLLWQQRSDLKVIPAERMLHAKRCDRLGQLRGVSEFASVITRLEDVKDYEESERIAAKIAASMAAYIKKGNPDAYEQATGTDGTPEARSLHFEPGMVFDDLMPGEEIGTIDTSRPNTNLQAHRDSQLRAVAAGVGASYSSISRNYNGTYSAQRQELVEQWIDYQTLTEDFVGQFVQPVYEKFVALAAASGLIPRAMLLDLAPGSLDDALFVGQQMPWIDPAKEADAFSTLEDRNYISAPEIIRRRGGNPTSVLDQQEKWVQMVKDRGLEKAAPAPAAPQQGPEQPDPAQQQEPPQ